MSKIYRFFYVCAVTLCILAGSAVVKMQTATAAAAGSSCEMMDKKCGEHPIHGYAICSYTCSCEYYNQGSAIGFCS